MPRVAGTMGGRPWLLPLLLLPACAGWSCLRLDLGSPIEYRLGRASYPLAASVWARVIHRS